MCITRTRALVTAALLAATAPHVSGGKGATESTQTRPASYRLEDLAWPEAERVLTPDAVVVIPLGGASVQHGRHLKLRTDATLASHFATRLASATAVVVAPAITQHHYPAFVEYPGTMSLPLESARDMTASAVRSLARHGPRRFYLLTAAPVANPALDAAAALLGRDGILARVTDAEGTLHAAGRPASSTSRLVS